MKPGKSRFSWRRQKIKLRGDILAGVANFLRNWQTHQQQRAATGDLIPVARQGGPKNQERRIATETPPIVISNDDVGAHIFNYEPAVPPPPMQQQR